MRRSPAYGGAIRLVLVCRVGSRFCALPLDHVEETMRPLVIEPLAAMPPFVLGLSIVRGNAIPVVDAGNLLGSTQPVAPTRFVTLKVEERRVALAVDEVVGIRNLAAEESGDLPPLLHDAGADAIAAVGTLDATLLLLLHGARLIPDAVWAELERPHSPS